MGARNEQQSRIVGGIPPLGMRRFGKRSARAGHYERVQSGAGGLARAGGFNPQGAPRKSLPQMGASAKRLLLAAQKAAKDEPELLDEVEQTLRQFEIAAAFAESELSIKH